MKAPIELANKHIALFLPGLYDGGAQRVVLNLAAGLINLGCKVDLVLVQAEGPYLNAIPASVRLIELNSKHLSSQRTLSSLPRLIRYMRNERPDAMLSGLNYANVIALWAKRLSGMPLRLCITEHNTFSIEGKQFRSFQRRILLALMKSAYPEADVIIAVSEGVATDLAGVLGIARDRITVIYNPIITPEIQMKIAEPVEDPWFIDHSPPVILAVGRLAKQKGFDILIKAFSELRKNREAHLLILGEGEERNALQGLCKQLGIETDVRLAGFVTNPYSYMANSALFVLSSRWEGLPTVLVEAMYCGLPLIATDCPSGPREILKDGEFGQLVPPEDANRLTNAMLNALDGKTTSSNSPSCWSEFELNTVIGKYLKTIIGDD